MGTIFVKVFLWIGLIAFIRMHGYKSCLEKERIGLLEIKSFFISISDRDNADDILTSWVDDPVSDCCGWEQVKCNASTRRLMQLSLSGIWRSNVNSDVFPILNLSLFHPFDELQSLYLCCNNFGGWNQNKGLGNLKMLEVLDLSSNRINGSLSGKGLANLKSLKFLDLSSNEISSSLAGQGICEMKNLVVLDLSWNNLDGHLPNCFSNLTYLKVLDLSVNQLNGKLPSVIGSLTSLEYLSLTDNNFEGIFSFNSLANLSKLQVLQLSSSRLEVEIENFSRLPKYQLKALNLQYCNLQAIPNFLLNQHNLGYINLAHNKLVGSFPSWLLRNNTKLDTLYLMNNSLSGFLQLPDSKHNLLHLDISSNSFSGHVPSNIGNILSELLDLIMSENSFEGNLPSSVGEMTKLRLLDFSSNNFLGALPEHFVTGCSSLLSLSLSNNNFAGIVFPKFMNFTNLEALYLDNNFFSGKIEDGLSKAFSLRGLDISSNMFSGQIPHWIGNMSNLFYLLSANNLLEGNIPIQLSNHKNLEILDISENSLSGPLTSFNLSSLSGLYMSKNAFNGSIPNSLLRNSKFISRLDLRNNHFSGAIPQWINESSTLRILLLRGNHLRGHIPNQLCQLKTISILDLSYNKFSDSIPACFTNMTLWVLGYHVNLLRIPRNLISRVDLSAYYQYFALDLSPIGGDYASPGREEVEFMTKNRYEPYEGWFLQHMTGLDLSSNELSGAIPPEIGNLQQIRALNFSHNYLSGSIPENFFNLKTIESLDISDNKLSGQIPSRLIELFNLAIFNVSYNNLSGPTPNKGQFATFDDNNYRGNPGLCGPTINKSCISTVELPAKPSSISGAEEDESAIDMVAFYWSFMGSFITIMLVFLAILWLNSCWRRVWFCFIDACIDYCFYWLLKFVLYYQLMCHQQ